MKRGSEGKVEEERRVKGEGLLPLLCWYWRLIAAGTMTAALALFALCRLDVAEGWRGALCATGRDGRDGVRMDKERDEGQ